MRHVITTGVAGVLLALAASATGAQQLSALPERLAPTTRATIERLADSLRGVGLPSQPLYAKAAEGVLKGAADARIVAAIRTLARELGEARAALGDESDEAELIAGASALHAGASTSTLRRLREGRGPRRAKGALAVPLVVLADLASRGIPPAVAGASLEALAARNASDDQFTALRAAIERDIEAGRPPTDAMTARTRALLGSIEARRP
ncbi:MAG: hypothetical protein ABR499_15225 [Gemmatimonadaceae bacterium]